MQNHNKVNFSMVFYGLMGVILANRFSRRFAFGAYSGLFGVPGVLAATVVECIADILGFYLGVNAYFLGMSVGSNMEAFHKKVEHWVLEKTDALGDGLRRDGQHLLLFSSNQQNNENKKRLTVFSDNENYCKKDSLPLLITLKDMEDDELNSIASLDGVSSISNKV